MLYSTHRHIVAVLVGEDTSNDGRVSTTRIRPQLVREVADFIGPAGKGIVMPRFTSSIHLRISNAQSDELDEAAIRWYRGNRTDLVRDAVRQHLDRLYSGQTQPAPMEPRPRKRVAEAGDQDLDSSELIW